jgi:hypothetical protein
MIQPLSTHGRNSYHALPLPDGPGQPQRFVAATFEGRVYAMTDGGELLWEHDTGAFCFDLRLSELDGRGLTALAACADGTLHAYRAEDGQHWSYRADGPLYQVTCGRLNGVDQQVFTAGVDHHIHVLEPSGQPVDRWPVPFVEVPAPEHRPGETFRLQGAVRLMDCADLTGTGRDHLIYTDQPRSQHCDVFAVGEGHDILWHTRIEIEGQFNFNMHSLAVGDLTGDGRADLVFASGRAARNYFGLVRLDADGNPLKHWINDDGANNGNHNEYIYRMPAIEIAPLPVERDPQQRPGIYWVMGPEVMLFDRDLHELDRVVASLSFTNLAMVPGQTPPAALLASSPNGDDTVYRLSFEDGWADAVETLERQGRVAEIGRQIRQVTRGLEGRDALPSASVDRPYLIEIAACKLHADRLHWPQKYLEHHQWVRAQLPYDNLDLATVFWVSEIGGDRRPDGGTWERDGRMDYGLTREQLVEFARKQEEADAPFLLQTAHGNGRFLTLETSQAMLEVAPRTLRGFVCAETKPQESEHYPYYVNHHLKPLAEMCLAHGGKKIILRDKGATWLTNTTIPAFRALLECGDYRGVFVPCVEDTNVATPELSLAVRVGLWLSGVTDHWAARVTGDNFTINRMFAWEAVMHGHPSLRMMLAHAALGAEVFMFHHGGDNYHGEGDWQIEDSPLRWHDVGIESELPFLHLLGQGLLKPPKRDELAHLAPVHLATRETSERCHAGAVNRHSHDGFGQYDEADAYVFSHMDCYWGNSPSPKNHASTYLYGNVRQFGNFVPPSPSGFVPIMPAWARPRPPVETPHRWTTDGDDFEYQGQTLSAAEGRPRILEQIEQHRSDLLYAAEGDDVFLQIARFDDYDQVLIVDPGVVDPEARTVTLQVNDPAIERLHDVITDDWIDVVGGEVSLTVDAGLFRLFHAPRQA